MIGVKSGKRDMNSNEIVNITDSMDIKKVDQAKIENEQGKVVEQLMEKIQDLHVDKTKFDSVESSKSNEDIETKKGAKTQNYFANLPKKSNSKKAIKIDEAKLNEVKGKILEKMKRRFKFPTVKEIPVDECYTVLSEHEKKIKVSLIKFAKLIDKSF